MAAVVLTRVVLALADDPAQQLQAVSSNPGENDSIEGEVRAYGGRRRILLGDDSGRTMERGLRRLTTEQVTLLRSWKGRALLLRDTYGSKIYGTYLTLSPRPYKDGTGWDVTFTFIESTFDEAV